MWCVLVVSLLVAAAATADQTSPPLANTPLGKVSGSYRLSRSGKKFAAFEKIPFAQPPVGNLRFQAPLPIGNWSGIYNASQDLPICSQAALSPTSWIPIGVEDCLYLSVFTHNVSEKAPVLVYIHGGGFAMGDAASRRPEYMMDEDLVIVQVNYRVGILGFLSFEDDILPGNQGMKDQVEALKWVKRNIASFGGDPNQVTINGESAGSTSVYHHIISPLSKGLFHRAIAESGTSYAIWAVAPPGFAKSKAEELLQKLNCSHDDLKLGLNCTLNKTATEIVSQFKELLMWRNDPLTQFGPVLEKPGHNAFLVGPISNWKPVPVPLLMGITSAEGLMFTSRMVNQNWTEFTEKFNDIAPKTFGYFSTASSPEDVTKQIRQYYLANPNITMKDWVNLTTVYTDIMFTIPAIECANKHSGDVFFYYFDYKLKELTPELDDKLIFGAIHVTEAFFIWKNLDTSTGKELLSRKEDIDMSAKLVKIVGNFAKFGNPSQNGSAIQKWDKWTQKNNNFMNISKAGFQQKKGIAEERYNFWKTVHYKDNYDKDSTGNSVSRKHMSACLLIMISIFQFFKLF